MLALKPPTAVLIVDMKKERLKALVRFASVALSASIAPQDDAYIASESPHRTAVPTSSGRVIQMRPATAQLKKLAYIRRFASRGIPRNSSRPVMIRWNNRRASLDFYNE